MAATSAVPRPRSQTFALGQSLPPQRTKLTLQPLSLLEAESDEETEALNESEPASPVSKEAHVEWHHDEPSSPEPAEEIATIPAPPSSLSSSEYVRLLRDRIAALEEHNAQQQTEIAQLHAQRQAQSNELQQVLFAAMQRTRAQTPSTPAPDARLRSGLGDVLAHTTAILTLASTSGNTVSRLRDTIIANVASEGELHRCAMQQAEFIRLVDGKHPNGMSEMTSEEHQRMHTLVSCVEPRLCWRSRVLGLLAHILLSLTCLAGIALSWQRLL
jgi:hypothetical protein